MAKNKSNKKSPSNSKQKKPKTQVIVKTVEVPRQMSIGAQIGDKLQRFAESTFSRLLGNGDYSLQDGVDQVKKNSLFTDTPKKSLRFGANSSYIVVEHSEFIGNIVSSATAGAFNTTVFPCDPTSPTTFPWLSQIAANFEQYEVEGLVFRLETLSGYAVAGTDSSIGSLSSVFLYDPTTDIPTNKQQLLQSYGSNTSVISRSQLVGVECAKESQVFDKLYIRESDATTEQRFYSKGNFVVATSGLKAASQTVAELWVHYKIKLLFPKQQVVNTDETDILFVSSPTITSTAGTLPLATTKLYSSSLGCTRTANNTSLYVNGLSQDQYYLVETDFSVAANTATINLFPAVLSGAATQYGSSASNVTTLAAGSNQSAYGYSIWKVNSTALNSVTLNAACYTGGGTFTAALAVRIYPLVNFLGTDWTDAQALTF